MRIALGVLAAILVAGLSLTALAEDDAKKIKITSTAFEPMQRIPLRNSAYGDGISPELAWSNLPKGTKQIAIIMDDPIVPGPKPFVHWVIYNIPATAKGLPENLTKDAVLTAPDSVKGATQGLSGIRKTGYFGPRSPNDGKVHEYHFTIYALDIETPLPEGLNKDTLLEAMKDHILATGELIGTYKYEG